MVTLRYSATHKNPYDLVYKLDPIRAYDPRLVKRIEVASVRSDENFNDAYVKLTATDNTNGIRARVEIQARVLRVALLVLREVAVARRALLRDVRKQARTAAEFGRRTRA